MITDNAIVAFESMHSINQRRKGKDGLMAIKLDMSKAYDRVEWAYLESMMKKMGFGDRWISLIMMCVTSVSLGDFKVTTPENPLLSKQAVTSKGITVPYTNLQLNLYPNTQLDLSVVTIFPFSSWIPVRDLITNLRRMLAAKYFSSSHNEDHKTPWSQNPMVYKHGSFFQRKMN